MSGPERVTLAMTGASGAPYGLRLLDCLVREDREVHFLISKAAQLVMATEAIGHCDFRVFTHGATAHHMGAAQRGSVQFQVQAVNQFACLGQGVHMTRIVMQWFDRLCAGGELDLGHAVKGPAQAVPGIR